MIIRTCVTSKFHTFEFDYSYTSLFTKYPCQGRHTSGVTNLTKKEPKEDILKLSTRSNIMLITTIY